LGNETWKEDAISTFLTYTSNELNRRGIRAIKSGTFNRSGGPDRKRTTCATLQRRVKGTNEDQELPPKEEKKRKTERVFGTNQEQMREKPKKKRA